MQENIARQNVRNFECTEEELHVTFQVALIGSSGIVVGSDCRASYVTQPTLTGPPRTQRMEVHKYLPSADDSVYCFAAGGPRASDIARAIVEPVPDYEYEAQWQSVLANRANSVTEPRNDLDEIIVVRTSVYDRVWVVTKSQNNGVTLLSVETKLCTGNPLNSRFIVSNFYKKNLSLRELQAIAALSIACAWQEHPSAVSPEMDILTFTKDGVSPLRLEKAQTETLLELFEKQTAGVLPAVMSAAFFKRH